MHINRKVKPSGGEMVTLDRYGRAEISQRLEQKVVWGSRYASGLCIVGMKCSIVSFLAMFFSTWTARQRAVLDEALLAEEYLDGRIMERRNTKAKFLWHIRPYFFSTDITGDFHSISHF
ncbi:hypothetical protein TNIN_163871 [Trichonephila inaurata madagascariensis]|uniref:Uncharacterized protein n=1 Tax=Trichonephila inaurata madagascariensis TaxID=2747483 RepID=A0A8X6XTV9_9ARAC|nr:hypothetical protein TNIN_163871 [Trichonephila inaurata madagascariensis]